MTIINKARNIELIKFIKKLLIGVVSDIFNNFYLPLLIITIFYVAVFYAKMSIAIPTVLVIKEMLVEFNHAGRVLTDCIRTFLEFLVSINRIQDFLLCEEANLSAIEYKEDKNISIRIKPSSFFWGFDEHEEVKNAKINKTKLQKINQNQEFSYTSKFLSLANLSFNYRSKIQSRNRIK